MTTSVTFPSVTCVARLGSNSQYNPRVLDAGFGDGYNQRVADGINNVPITWTILYRNISQSDHDTILAFLVARGGAQAFLFNPPDGSGQLQVICKSWKSAPSQPGLYDIDMTLTQVFDP